MKTIRLASYTLLLVALGIYYFTVLSVHPLRTPIVDLEPTPDAIEYTATARSFYSLGTFDIRLGSEWVPSRYPFGYPLLVASWMYFSPQTKLTTAAFRVNESLGIAMILLVFFFFWARKRPFAGGIAALLLATLPAFIVFARAPMSELFGALLVMASFMGLILGFEQNRRWPLYMAVIFLGLAVNVRLQLILLAPLLVAVALLPRRTLKSNLTHGVISAFLFLVCWSPSLIYNQLRFGHFLTNGYNFWVPYWDIHHSFALSYIKVSLNMLWSELSLQWNNFRVANMYSTGSYFVPAFVMLTIGSLIRLRGSRLFFTLLPGVAFYTFATLCYFFAVDSRLYFPLLVVATLSIAPLVEDAFIEATSGLRKILPVCTILLFGLAIIGYPSRTGFPPRADQTHLTSALLWPMKKSEPVRYSRASYAKAALSGKDHTLLFSDIDSVYLSLFFPNNMWIAPIDQHHNYNNSNRWRYGKNEAKELLDRAILEKRKVFALAEKGQSFANLLERLPLIDGHLWQPLHKGDRKMLFLAKREIEPNKS